MKSYLGDCVMGTPLFLELERAFDRVTYFASGGVDQVLWMPDRTRTVVKSGGKKHPSAVLKEAQWMRSQRFDAVVLVNHSFRSALTATLAGIPIRVGHDAEHRQILLTHAVPYGQGEFEAESSLDLARALGIEAPSALPFLPITAEERVQGRELLGTAMIGLQPGARFGRKRLTHSTTVEIGNALSDAGYKIVLLGGPDEAEFAEPVAAELRVRPANLVGKTNIRGSLGVLANLRLMIGSDTGLMHMAAAVGCPTITVFGPTPLIKWGHQYPPHAALQAPGGVMANVCSEEVVTTALKSLKQ